MTKHSINRLKQTAAAVRHAHLRAAKRNVGASLDDLGGAKDKSSMKRVKQLHTLHTKIQGMLLTAFHQDSQKLANEHLGAAAQSRKEGAAYVVGKTLNPRTGRLATKKLVSGQQDLSRRLTEFHERAARANMHNLPQGYAMVFGKLRKINPKGKRTGIAKLKR